MPEALTSTHNGYRKSLGLAFISGFGIMLLVLLPVIIRNGGYFIYYSDYNTQQIPFYHLAAEQVRNGFGWSWTTDLGADFIGSYAFYLLGSPFFWLCAVLPSDAVVYAMPFVLALKHGIAACTGFAFIRRFTRTDAAAVIGGLLYAFSGFQMFNLAFNHFHDVTALFPLILIAMEELVTNNRKGVFALSAALMAVVNYFFFAGEALFLVLYFAVRCFSKDFPVTAKKFAQLLLEAVIGVALACFMLLPAAMAVAGNPRLDISLSGIDMLLYNAPVIQNIIKGFFMLPDMASRMNLFASETTEFASIGGYLPLFSISGVIAFGFGQRRHWASWLTILSIVFACIPVLNSLFYMLNGTYYGRWFFMPVLIMALMTALSLEDKKLPHTAGIIASASVIAVIALIAVSGINTSQSFKSDGSLRFPAEFWCSVVLCLVSLGAAAGIFVLLKKDRSIMKAALPLTIAACTGCCMWAVYFPAANADKAAAYAGIAIDAENDMAVEVSEDNFFRIDQSRDYMNYSMLWDLPSTDSFHSIVPQSVTEFYNSLSIQRTVLSDADTDCYALRQLFSVKYYLGSDGEELPGFEYSGDMNSIPVYENNSVLPMGFAYDSYIAENVWERCYMESRCNLLLRALVLSNEQIEKYKNILSPLSAEETEMTAEELLTETEERRTMSCRSFTYDSSGFTAEYSSDKPSLVFFSVPYSDGWTAKVNGKAVEIEKAQIGFMAVPVDSGESLIEFSYETPALKTGAVISLTGAAVLAVYMTAGYITRKKKRRVSDAS